MDSRSMTLLSQANSEGFGINGELALIVRRALGVGYFGLVVDEHEAVFGFEHQVGLAAHDLAVLEAVEDGHLAVPHGAGPYLVCPAVEVVGGLDEFLRLESGRDFLALEAAFGEGNALFWEEFRPVGGEEGVDGIAELPLLPRACR